MNPGPTDTSSVARLLNPLKLWFPCLSSRFIISPSLIGGRTLRKDNNDPVSFRRCYNHGRVQSEQVAARRFCMSSPSSTQILRNITGPSL